MSGDIFNVKGEFYKGERIYMVHHSMLYHSLRNNHTLLIDFIRRIAEVLNIFHCCGIVHADLKSENIIINFDE